MLARLDAAQASRPMPDAAAAPLLDEMSRRAQERLLLAQVVPRDPGQPAAHGAGARRVLPRQHEARRARDAGKDSQQIRGALQMLELDDAERLLALCQEQIEAYADPETAVSNEDLELLAESLSGLGFYVEAVEQQRPDRDRLIAPLLARRLGEGPASARPCRPTRSRRRSRSSAPRCRASSTEVHRAPADAAARAALKSKLTDLRNDAELIGDAELVAQATSALAEFETGGTAALAATVTAIAETCRARARDLGGDAAAARDRRDRARCRAPRDLPHRGRRGARYDPRPPRGARPATRAIARRCARSAAASTR